MSNNTVNIRGYLTYRAVGMNRRPASVVGWIYTDRALLGGRHPFIANGRPAEIIMEYVQEREIRSVESPPDFPDQATGVVVRGKLASYPDGSYLDVRSVHFFQASLSLERFVLNDLTLGGQLMIKDGQRSPRTEIIGSATVTALDALLATDAAYNGGIHPILLLNKHAEQALAWFEERRFQPFGVTVGGRLVTLPGGSLVQASFVCPDEEKC